MQFTRMPDDSLSIWKTNDDRYLVVPRYGDDAKRIGYRIYDLRSGEIQEREFSTITGAKQWLTSKEPAKAPRARKQGGKVG